MKQHISTVFITLGVIFSFFVITGFSTSGNEGRYQAFDTGSTSKLGILDTQTGEAKIFVTVGQNRYQMYKASYQTETLEVTNIKIIKQITKNSQDLDPFIKP